MPLRPERVRRALPRSRRRARAGVHTVALAVVLTVSTLVAPALAAVFIGSRMAARIDGLAEGVVMLDVESGSPFTIGGDPAWTAGTPSNTVVVDGALRLDHRGEVPPGNGTPWWNTTWTTRQCFVVGLPDDQADDVPIRVVLDTLEPFAIGALDSDGSGLRAIGSRTGSELPLWIEGPIPDPATEVWVRLDVADREFCLYWDNPAAGLTSNEASVFTAPAPTVRYYTLTGSYTGTGNGGTLSVVSYGNGNEVTVDGATQTGDRGQVLTFAGVTGNSVITATAPVSGTGRGNATDAIVPESYADTEFVFPTLRGVQTIWVRAPFGPVELEFRHGTRVFTATVTPADGTVGIVADAVESDTAKPDAVESDTVESDTAEPDTAEPDTLKPESASVRSINGVAFLAMNTSQANDSIVGVPFTGEPLYGMRTRDLRVGAGFADAQYSLAGSDGTDIPAQSVAAGFTNVHPPDAKRLDEPAAFRVAPRAGRIAALQQKDGTGTQSTSFLPYSLLDTEYFLPHDATQVSMACPVPGQGVTVELPDGTMTDYPCTSPSGAPGAPGRAVSSTSLPAGTRLHSSQRFFATMAKSGSADETNLIGPSAAPLPPRTTPPSTAGPVEGTHLPSGTWVSSSIDTEAVGSYGIVAMVGSLPTGTEATLQVASGISPEAAQAAPFIGPDGTASTAYTSVAQVMSADHDRHRFLRLSIVLTSTDPLVSPSIDDIRLRTDLTEFDTVDTGLVVVPVTVGSGFETRSIARLSTEIGETSVLRIDYLGGSGLPDAAMLTARTDHPAAHVQAIDGAIESAIGPEIVHEPGDVFDLILDSDVMPGSTVTFDIRISFESVQGLVLEKDVRFVISDSPPPTG